MLPHLTPTLYFRPFLSLYLTLSIFLSCPLPHFPPLLFFSISSLVPVCFYLSLPQSPYSLSLSHFLTHYNIESKEKRDNIIISFSFFQYILSITLTSIILYHSHYIFSLSPSLSLFLTHYIISLSFNQFSLSLSLNYSLSLSVYSLTQYLHIILYYYYIFSPSLQL